MRLSRRTRKLIFPLVLSAALIAPAATATSHLAPSGVDVASWQRSINWQQVNETQEFAFVKATEGTTYKNPQYDHDIKQARDSGLVVGAYHYARPHLDPVEQAKHFAAAYNAYPQDLPPVMDIEQTDGVAPQQLIAWTRTFLNETERLTGRVPMVYTYRYFWQEDMANTTEFNSYPLWFAAYQNDVPGNLPGGWDQMAFWQRADNGSVSGITTPVDMNLFNGTPAQLNGFSGYGGVLTPGEIVATETSLGRSAKQLAGALLSLADAIGILPPEQAGAMAQQVAGFTGIDAAVAGAVGEHVKKLNGNLPVADLNVMLSSDQYSVGDLMLLLNAAGHQNP